MSFIQKKSICTLAQPNLETSLRHFRNNQIRRLTELMDKSNRVNQNKIILKLNNSCKISITTIITHPMQE